MMKVNSPRPPCARSAWGGGPLEERWRGLLSQKSPSTVLRTVPLPIASGDREDEMPLALLLGLAP